VVETNQDGEKARHAAATLHEAEDDSLPPAYDVTALLAAHPVSISGNQLRETFAGRGVQLGAAFAGLHTAHTTAPGAGTVLAADASRASIRFQQGAYCVHPALLDACFQSVGAGVDASAGGGLLLPLGVRHVRAYGPTRNARYCYARVTVIGTGAAAGGEADL